MEGDAIYFRRRATEERAAATKAANSAAHDAHLELAARYDELAASIGAREQQLARNSIGAI